MPINKFGLSLQKSDTVVIDKSYDRWSGLIRNYIRDNALCRTTTDFDAQECKIRRVAQPEIDSDAANKQYVEERVKYLKNQQEEFEKKIIAFEKDVHALRIVINDLQKLKSTTKN